MQAASGQTRNEGTFGAPLTRHDPLYLRYELSFLLRIEQVQMEKRESRCTCAGASGKAANSQLLGRTGSLDSLRDPSQRSEGAVQERLSPSRP